MYMLEIWKYMFYYYKKQNVVFIDEFAGMRTQSSLTKPNSPSRRKKNTTVKSELFTCFS